ncbi:hypothetical protein BDW22DRAFT_1047058 [Trametopsis cervina]|nr:hypothetical protein BDW22DRAFT_1047058 [Trametopsis cervina]
MMEYTAQSSRRVCCFTSISYSFLLCPGEGTRSSRISNTRGPKRPSTHQFGSPLMNAPPCIALATLSGDRCYLLRCSVKERLIPTKAYLAGPAYNDTRNPGGKDISARISRERTAVTVQHLRGSTVTFILRLGILKEIGLVAMHCCACRFDVFHVHPDRTRGRRSLSGGTTCLFTI